MILIGIVGALTPLGLKMREVLKSYSADFDVIWTVDLHYECDNLQQSEFKIVENVLASGLSASLVLDFGSYDCLFERAKLYRRNGIPAIIQGVLPNEQIEILKGIGEETSLGPKYASLLFEPEFSPVKTQILKNLICQVHHCACDVSRIYITTEHHANKQYLKSSWLYWANLINNVLGEYTDRPIIRETKLRSVFTLGFVRVCLSYKFALKQSRENIRIDMLLSGGKGMMSWNINASLLDSRADGVLQLLDWYASKREISQDLVFGDILVDVLPNLI